VDPNCDSHLPVIHVACKGNIAVNSTSDPTIECGTETQRDAKGFNFKCTNTCQGTACESLWLQASGGSIADGASGEIEFECSGEIFDDIGAYTFYEDSVSVCPAFEQPALLRNLCPRVGDLERE